MEQQGQIAENYQIVFIPNNSGPTQITGSNIQFILPQGCYEYSSIVECQVTIPQNSSAQYMCQRKEFWPFLQQANIVCDGIQIGQFINLAAAQYNYYQQNYQDQQEYLAQVTGVTNLCKKRWNILGKTAVASTVYTCCMELGQFLAGCGFPQKGGKLRVFNQMQINVQIGALQAGSFAFMTNLSNIVDNAVIPSAIAFNLYGKLSVGDTYVQPVITKAFQQYFAATGTINCNFSVGANQICKYIGILSKKVSSTAGNNTAIQFEEPEQDATNFQFQRNGYNIFSSQQAGTAPLSTQQICQIFSLLASNKCMFNNSLAAVFDDVYSNSLINHLINVGTSVQDFYFTYIVQEANPLGQQQ